jgi:hypothetical protein
LGGSVSKLLFCCEALWCRLKHIGAATSNINGNYGYAFTPDVLSTYQIIARFAGSESYGASFSTTYLAVGEAIFLFFFNYQLFLA